MKHVKAMSKPATADQTAWLSLKNICCLIKGGEDCIEDAQAFWIVAVIDSWLQK